MNEIGRKITDKLIEIHGSKDFSIAFLPYKRSMWNSMQSVYEECKASGIEAHCMPIEYICMKENREIDYITSDFFLFGDIAEPIENLGKVDYIAIHYPYDGSNYVTSMLPRFYTSALKETYHAKVIYLPYGTGMGQPQFLHSGCRDVDYAFMEDETNARMFIEYWAKEGIDFEGRVFALGSAKLDMARDLPRVVPPEWAETIGDRSVTLVITSLGPFLHDPFGRLDKYEEVVMEEASKPRNAVIFRPHPLMWPTIKSLLPETEERYKTLLSLFNTTRKVRVDVSEYLERAMSVADYLVSDPSSVVNMWMETGKPYKIIEGE